jgi:deoxycytidine triphosphate deaminase
VTRSANSDKEAEDRYKQFASIDPFPQIQPALLNSADIIDYVATTGMVYPFHEERRLLKVASYGVPLGGHCIYWTEDGTREEFILSDSSHEQDEYPGIPRKPEFVLKSNSIAFVTLEPIFRLPEYIALRFNLAIREVYRGLLLGTGPLVDPGFIGRLSFPLHNLTNETYCFRAGEEVVWIEFTKVSTWMNWVPYPENEKRNGTLYKFQEEKRKRRDVDDYLHFANPGRAVRSSIPIEIKASGDVAKRASEHALAARNHVDALTRRLRTYSVLGGIAFGVALVALVVELLSHGEHILTATDSMVSGARLETQTMIGSVRNEMQSVTAASALIKDDLLKQIQATKTEDAELKKAIDDLGTRIHILEGKIGQIENRPSPSGR